MAGCTRIGPKSKHERQHDGLKPMQVICHFHAKAGSKTALYAYHCDRLCPVWPAKLRPATLGNTGRMAPGRSVYGLCRRVECRGKSVIFGRLVLNVAMTNPGGAQEVHDVG
jgi:hypothetical protein